MPGGGGHHGCPALLFRHIKRLEPRRGANRIGHLPAFVLQHVGDHHFGAFAREHARRPRPHAGCRAGDDGDLVRESHFCVLPFALNGAQRPVKFGRRFWAKAHTASWWSFVRFDCVSRLRLRSIIEWAS